MRPCRCRPGAADIIESASTVRVRICATRNLAKFTIDVIQEHGRLCNLHALRQVFK